MGVGLVGGVRLRAAGARNEHEGALPVQFHALRRLPNADPEGERVRLCVYGQDPIGPALDTIDGKPLGGGRLVTVVRTRSLAGLGSCRLLYVADAEAGDMPKVMAALGGKPVLVVAESPLARGSAAIVWSLQHSRLVFDVNLKAVRQADLRMSSKLLRLARTVEE
jgi:hypothetical protein